MTRQLPQRVEFTKEMAKDYTILVPNMAPIHFELLKNVFRENGYRLEILQNEGRAVVDAGLKYVHNDTCYPALLVIGQFINALQSGKYDLNKTALMITQTGGGCRASNYIHLLRKALIKAGLGSIPVISLNMSGLEKNSGFHLTLSLVRKCLSVLAYGDLLMLLYNQVRPYEIEPGAAGRLTDERIELDDGTIKARPPLGGKWSRCLSASRMTLPPSPPASATRPASASWEKFL